MSAKMPEDREQGPVVHHSSGRVYCNGFGQPAVVSVIERGGRQGAIRYVLWCSLRGIGDCDEECLRRRALA